MFATLLFCALAACLLVQANAQEDRRPAIRKLGTIVCDLVEATPVVWQGRLYRFEYVRHGSYKPNTSGDSYFRFVDVQSNQATAGFAAGYHLGCAHVEGDRVWAFGTNIWDGERIQVFWSDDMQTWHEKPALELPGWGIFNTSVCKGPEGYVMAFEIGRPPEETGAAFTTRFAVSDDLLTWRLTSSECVFSKDRYTACPAIRYLDDGYYYMTYLEARPGPTYESHIVRSKDLVAWESSLLNPILHHDDQDRKIIGPDVTEEERERIATAVNLNNSDVDLCEFEGKTVIYYSWGNQQGVEHLAEAVYEGPMDEFLKGWFPE